MSKQVDLEAIKARVARATKGPWVAENRPKLMVTIYLTDPLFYGIIRVTEMKGTASVYRIQKPG